MVRVYPEKPGEGSSGLNSAAVFERYRDRIRRYIGGLVRDSAEADDLLQETFVRVHRKLDSLGDPATLTTWLYRIATNVCYDRFRQPAHRRTAQAPSDSTSGESGEPPADDPDAPSLSLVIEQAEMSTCVREYIEQLSDDYRMVILLHDLHGMSNPEIARALDCSLATVKIRLHRARQKLKAALSTACDFTCDERGVFVCDRKRPVIGTPPDTPQCPTDE
jgi:RNA polymerase sigma-70 factor (ECF subfamily)